jgi:hypothetical protein
MTTANKQPPPFSSNNSVSSIGGFSNASRLSGISRTSKGSTNNNNGYRELSVLEYMERRSQSQNKGLSQSKVQTGGATGAAGVMNNNSLLDTTTGNVGEGPHSLLLESTILNVSYEHLDADDIQNHLSLQEAVQSRIQQQQHQAPPQPSEESFVHVVNHDGQPGHDSFVSTTGRPSQSQQQPQQRRDVVVPVVPSYMYSSLSPEPMNTLQRNSSSSSKKLKSTPKNNGVVEKMDKAQMRLLYGDLPDLSDAKKMWEKSLRR